jgi:hypothetical protein
MNCGGSVEDTSENRRAFARRAHRCCHAAMQAIGDTDLRVVSRFLQRRQDRVRDAFANEMWSTKSRMQLMRTVNRNANGPPARE